MGEEKIYPIDKNCKTYLKLQSPIQNLEKKAIILSIIVLISSYIVYEILNLSSIGIYIIFIYVIVAIVLTIKSIINFVKFIKIGNSYVIRSKNEILFFYNDKSEVMLSSVNSGMILGGTISQSHSNVGKAIGIGISVASSLNKDVDNHGETNILEAIPPNMTVDNIINDPKTFYDLYKNIKFVKKTKKYLYFNGDKFNVNNIIKNSNFRIERTLYKDIDDILK